MSIAIHKPFRVVITSENLNSFSGLTRIKRGNRDKSRNSNGVMKKFCPTFKSPLRYIIRYTSFSKIDDLEPLIAIVNYKADKLRFYF